MRKSHLFPQLKLSIWSGQDAENIAYAVVFCPFQSVKLKQLTFQAQKQQREEKAAKLQSQVKNASEN